MNEWALLKEGRVVNVVMTNMCKSHMQKKYPDFEVADIYRLPAHVQEGYRYWNERP